MASEKDAETVEHSGRAGKQKASARNSLENIAEKALDGSSATIRNDAEKDGSGKDDVVEERDNESREDDDDDVDIEAQQVKSTQAPRNVEDRPSNNIQGRHCACRDVGNSLQRPE